MTQKLTLQDIRNAVKELNKDRKIVKRYDKDGNWIGINQATLQIETIGLGKKAVKAYKKLWKNYPQSKKKGKVGSFEGVPILVSQLEDSKK